MQRVKKCYKVFTEVLIYVIYSKLCFLNKQVTKKERQESRKTVTITPSDSTHFRVILSSEAMEKDAETEKEDAVLPVCTIVRPEPRTPTAIVTPEGQLSADSTASSLSPVTPTEALAILPSSVATSTPANNQLTDSPSKKKGPYIFTVTAASRCTQTSLSSGFRSSKEEPASGSRGHLPGRPERA